jgi:hypothetical protein
MAKAPRRKHDSNTTTSNSTRIQPSKLAQKRLALNITLFSATRVETNLTPASRSTLLLRKRDMLPDHRLVYTERVERDLVPQASPSGPVRVVFVSLRPSSPTRKKALLTHSHREREVHLQKSYTMLRSQRGWVNWMPGAPRTEASHWSQEEDEDFCCGMTAPCWARPRNCFIRRDECVLVSQHCPY